MQPGTGRAVRWVRTHVGPQGLRSLAPRPAVNFFATRGHRKRECTVLDREALTPPANPRERADLRAAWPAMARFVPLIDGLRVDDLLRCAWIISRRDGACRRQRRLGDGDRRVIGAEWRNAGVVADAARIGSRPGIGGTVRYAVDRREASAGRSRRWSQLRQDLIRQDLACEAGADEHGDDKRNDARHLASPVLYLNDIIARVFPHETDFSAASSVSAVPESR
jgi:hypothetical protein